MVYNFSYGGPGGVRRTGTRGRVGCRDPEEERMGSYRLMVQGSRDGGGNHCTVATLFNIFYKKGLNIPKIGIFTHTLLYN